MEVTRICPKCKKLAAKYRFNKAGNLAFYECVHCGYSAKDYVRDLKGKK
jgi:Zn ribbon nucleic-acid-binding protein